MLILGLNAAYHESAACLLRDGQIVAALEQERLNRVKHGKPTTIEQAEVLPWEAMASCLAAAGVDWSQVAHVAYSFVPVRRRRKNSRHQHPYPIAAGDYGSAAGEQRLYEKLSSLAEVLRRRTDFRGSVHFLPHHDCHAASVFYPSGLERAAVLVIDGIGEFESTTLYQGTATGLSRVFGIPFPHSLGLLWEKLSEFLGFSAHDACKVMGLSAYGDPARYRGQLGALLQLRPDGHFTVDDSLLQSRSRSFGPLEQLLGLPKLKSFPHRFAPAEREAPFGEALTPYLDVAAALQEATNGAVLGLAQRAQRLGERSLCMAGGVALNCSTNGRLLAAGLFADLIVQPAAHDAGTALGAALLLWHRLPEGRAAPPVRASPDPYLGPAYGAAEVEQTLLSSGLRFERCSDIASRVAALLAAGRIVARFQGALEFGPRALGNRSILADPRDSGVRERLNRLIKHRELYRPFCPTVLEERAAEWFDLGTTIPNVTRYMLAAVAVQASKRALIPAVVHVDGTARVQVLSAASNPKFYALIAAFAERTGVPIVLNTSFNDCEPIVCSPKDALRTFLQTGIDYLAIEDFLAPHPAL